MSDFDGLIEIANSNSYAFTNASNNDMVIYPSTSNQNILLGIKQNTQANIEIDMSNIIFSVNGSASNRGFKFLNEGNNELLNITSVGNIGISKSNPQYTLDVNGTINSSSLLINGAALSANIGGGFVASNTSNTFTLCNVGIGTSNALSPLHIRTTAGVGMTLEGVPSTRFLISRTTSNNLASLIYATGGTGTGNGTAEICISGDNRLRFNTNNSSNTGTYIERMSIDTDGIVNFTNRIQLPRATANRRIVLYELSNNDHEYYGYGINGNTLRYQVDNIASSHIFFAGLNSNNSVELMRIRGNGNVGIGTTSPNAPLQFPNTQANRKIVLWENTNNDHQFYGFGINPSSLRYQVDNINSSHIFFAALNSNNSVELMRMQGNGNVGVGTSNPIQMLHVRGQTSNDTILFVEPGEWNSAGDYSELHLGDSNHFIRGEFSNGMLLADVDRLRFATSNGVNVRMTIERTGNILMNSNLTACNISGLTINGTTLQQGGTGVSLVGHNHDASNITTGTLPVARGGTGTTTSTGTGNVVLSASPTITGTATIAAIDCANYYEPTPFIYFDNNNGGGTTRLTVQNTGPNDGSPQRLIMGIEGAKFSGTAVINTTWTGVAGNVPISIRTSNLERFRINTTGIVQVNSNLTACNISGLLINGTSLQENGIDVALVGHTHDASNITTGTLLVARGGTGTTTSTGTGNVVLSVSPTLTGTVSAQTVNTTSLSSTTQIFGNSNDSVSNPSFSFIQDSNTGIYHPPANDNLGFVTAGTERIRIDNNGNVGIGKSNPTTTLDVNGIINAVDIQENGVGVALIGHNHDASNITTGTLQVARGGTGTTTSTGTGNVVLSASPAITGTLIVNNKLDIVHSQTSNWWENGICFAPQDGVTASNALGLIQFPDDGTERNSSNPRGGWAIGRGNVYSERRITLRIPDYSAYSNTGSIPEFEIITTGSSNILTCTANGNVGIGTTNPNAQLQLNNNTANRKIVLYDVLNNDHEYIGLGLNGSTFRYQIDQPNSSHVFFTGTTSGSSAELMRLTGRGLLGIGTDNPSAQIHINNSTFNTSNYGILLGGSRYSTLPSSVNGILVTVGNNIANNRQLWIMDSSNTDKNTSNIALRMIVRGTQMPVIDGITTDDTQSRQIQVGSSSGIFIPGSIGIGTSNQNAPLQFANTTVNRKIVLLEGANNDHQYYGFGVNGNTLRYQVVAAADRHVFFAGTSASTSTEIMRIQGNGFVGIGTTNPTKQLDVLGRGLFKADGAGGTLVLIPSTPGSEASISYYTNSNETGNVWVAGQGSFSVGQSNFSIACTDVAPFLSLIRSTGFMGVRTNTPSSTLDVNGVITLRNGNGFNSLTSNQILFGWNNGVDYRHAIKTRHNSANSATNSYDFFGWQVGQAITDIGNKHIMSLTSLGYVGLNGTSNPNAPLHFDNALQNRKIILWETSNNDHQYYGFGINNSVLRYQVDLTSSAHIFYTGTSSTTSTELMRIQGNGLVGIGQFAPVSLQGSSLHVQTSNVFALQAQFENRGTGRAGIALTSTGGSTFITHQTDNALAIYGSSLQSYLSDTNFIYMDNSQNQRAIIRTTNGQATWNVANATFYVGRDATTLRSINAAGTLNASGADYAEYMVKSSSKIEFNKGDIVGIDSQGKLTDKYSESISFGVKSTNPSMVGGDIWFSNSNICPADSNSKEYQEWMNEYSEKRKMIDRIGFCGRVPINLYSANPGDYIVPYASLNDTILASNISEEIITFTQYKKAVGKVLCILEDGRADIKLIN